MSVKSTILLPILIFCSNILFAQINYDFAIYTDYGDGAWEDGITAFENFLDWKQISHLRVDADYINTNQLQDNFKAIYFPGGDADYYNASLNNNGIESIKNLIMNGGGYIGMCAGAEFACDSLIWEEHRIDYPLDLFQGKSIGPIDELAVWPNYDMTTLNMHADNILNQYEPETEDMLYWGGSIFKPYPNANFDTIATFSNYNNEIAIVNFEYGNGRVLLISPHPEIEEDSNRDNVAVAEELNDNGSDWPFLWTATDWLLGKELSNPNITGHFENYENKNCIIYPNPSTSSIYIQIKNNQIIKNIKIYSLNGHLVKSLLVNKNTCTISDIPKGLYIAKIETNNNYLTEKLIIK